MATKYNQTPDWVPGTEFGALDVSLVLLTYGERRPWRVRVGQNSSVLFSIQFARFCLNDPSLS